VLRCKRTYTDLSEEEVYVILEPYFDVAKGFYSPIFKNIKNTRFEVSREAHDSSRHFAGCSEDGRLIVLAPQLVELSEDVVVAIILHELGHALDFLNPGTFIVERDKLVIYPDSRLEDKRQIQAKIARQKNWDNRDPYTVELTADLIAEKATGNRIGYVGPCYLQALNRGVARPKNLR
jgi:hypothetical protein